MSLLFFGAGASRPFAVPTMQEMVTDFENKLKSSHPLFQFYQTIKNSLIEQYGSTKIDIEAMLSVLHGMSDKIEPKDLGYFTYFYMRKNCSNNKFSSDEVANAKQLVNILKDYIKNCCTVGLSPQDRTKIYEKSYLPLFSNLHGKKETYLQKFSFAIDWKSYTTNYDNIFEGFWESFHEPTTHFDRQGSSNNYIFNTTKTLGHQSLAKLHGSLDWTKIKETGNIFRSSRSGFETFETEGEVMLYPIQQKDLYLHPWFTLFQDFKSGLTKYDRWYVIGYAFNDEFIFNVFEEALRTESKQLIIINPNAEEIRKKFPQFLRPRIIALPYKFGDNSFENNFIDFQQNKKNISLSIETNASKFRIEFPSIIIEKHVIDMLKGKYDGDTQSETGTSYMDFSIGGDLQIKANMNVSINFDYTKIEPLEFKFITNSQNDIKIDLKSNGNYIDVFTKNVSEPTDSSKSFFVYVKHIPIRNFLK